MILGTGILRIESPYLFPPMRIGYMLRRFNLKIVSGVKFFNDCH